MFREQLVLKALAALQEIADECGEAPARKSLSLRFLLAYTFIAAGGRSETKWLWTDFWKHATAGRSSCRWRRRPAGARILPGAG